MADVEAAATASDDAPAPAPRPPLKRSPRAAAFVNITVLSGAISTILASIPMLFTQIIFFYKFGVFILLTIVLSLIFSLFFFASVLAEIGLGSLSQMAEAPTQSLEQKQNIAAAEPAPTAVEDDLNRRLAAL